MKKYFYYLMLGTAIFTNQSVEAMEEPTGGVVPRKVAKGPLDSSSSSGEDEQDSSVKATMRLGHKIIDDMRGMNRLVFKLGRIVAEPETQGKLQGCSSHLGEIEDLFRTFSKPQQAVEEITLDYFKGLCQRTSDLMIEVETSINTKYLLLSTLEDIDKGIQKMNDALGVIDKHLSASTK